MATTDTAARPVGCTTCGRVDAPNATYLRRGPDVIVQGVQLATCESCISLPEREESAHCDGRCRGNYTTMMGTYYEVRWRPTRSRSSYLGWACWDPTCVDDWLEHSWLAHDQGVDCSIVTIVDGKPRDE